MKRSDRAAVSNLFVINLLEFPYIRRVQPGSRETQFDQVSVNLYNFISRTRKWTKNKTKTKNNSMRELNLLLLHQLVNVGNDFACSTSEIMPWLSKTVPSLRLDGHEGWEPSFTTPSNQLPRLAMLSSPACFSTNQLSVTMTSLADAHCCHDVIQGIMHLLMQQLVYRLQPQVLLFLVDKLQLILHVTYSEYWIQWWAAGTRRVACGKLQIVSRLFCGTRISGWEPLG